MNDPMIMNGKVSINSFGKQPEFFDLALPDQTCFSMFCLEPPLLSYPIPLLDDWEEALLDDRSFLSLLDFDFPGMDFLLIFNSP